ncbi:MAG TPA: GAF domain-containing protein [Candidatus Udaeobacter sp.]|nr:GAF domain-containing protein [Candidatus Udaeobacter sp.]
MGDHARAEAIDSAVEPTLDRLHEEILLLRERNREYALLFQVLGVLHSTAELEAVLRIVLTAVTAGSALGFNRALVFLVDPDGTRLRGRAGLGPATGEEAALIWGAVTAEDSFSELAASAARARPGSSPLDRVAREISLPLGHGDSVFADVVRSGRAMVVTDLPEGRLPAEFLAAVETKSCVVAPILARGRVLGVIYADHHFTGRPIREEEVELLTNLAGHAGLAIEKAQMTARLEQRLDERSTLHEVAKGILTTTDLATELTTIARISAQVIGAEGSVLWLLEDGWGRSEAAESALAGDAGLASGRPPEPRLEVAATFGAGNRLAAQGPQAAVHAVAEQVARRNAPALLPELGGEEAGSLLCVPLLVRERPIGALGVFGKIPGSILESAVFALEDQEFLLVLADQAAIAIENARLFTRVRETEERLREGEAIRARIEKLAALGEMSAKVAHEIRNPLASVGGFARRLLPHFSPGTNERQAVEIIVSETARLERILSTQLEFTQLTPPRLELTDLNAVVEETLLLVLAEAQKRRVRVLKKLDPELPHLLLDADKMKQVLLNLFQNGIEALFDGGRFRVETGRLDTHVMVEVATDGDPIPGDMIERLFVPFATSKRQGSGLGLAVALKLVREHGGQIRVRSEGEWGAIFSVVLPISGNEDRRRPQGDRRHRLLDRRDPGRVARDG